MPPTTKETGAVSKSFQKGQPLLRQKGKESEPVAHFHGSDEVVWLFSQGWGCRLHLRGYCHLLKPCLSHRHWEVGKGHPRVLLIPRTEHGNPVPPVRPGLVPNHPPELLPQFAQWFLNQTLNQT